MNAEIIATNLISTLVGKEKIDSFEDKLFLNNFRIKNISDYVKFCIIEGIILMLIIMIITNFYLTKKPEAFIGIGLIFFIIPFIANYIFQDLIFERNKRKKEELIPDLLLEASVFCDETNIINTIEKLSKQDFGLLGNDFSRALLEIQKGASINEALTRIKKLNKSKVINRAIDLLLQSYSSGGNLSDALKETAEDILENQAIIKERQAVMLVTKYTLVISAGLIVPAIIGTIIGMVSNFNFGINTDLGFGLSLEERTNLFNLTKFGSFLYIIEYALLSSYFLGLQENNKKNFFIYSIIITPIAIIIFFITQTF